MSFLSKALLLLVLAVFCVHLGTVFANIPDRCWCEEATLISRARKESVEEFAVFPNRTKCKTVEIILTLKTKNNSTNNKLCLNPEKNQGQNLQNCWKRLNTNGTSTTLKFADCFNKTKTQTL
ncbi:hypothetical protein DNTS_002521 [Danionella cerebrum]|uniref:Chemokine interleukin-8-like domain-containing protein n=1 Tax=Danionella cerebrum TaxID=2873325 RepID=A0A553MSJ9_9TELE|nr:hypothetical protein DNTS_002521 [Danionella translucida]